MDPDSHQNQKDIAGHVSTLYKSHQISSKTFLVIVLTDKQIK